MPDALLKVLHVLGSLHRGGAETWLMHVLRHINREHFHVDFLVHSSDVGDYEDEAQTLGARVLRCLHPSDLAGYGQRFRQILQQDGPYHVVHTHVHQYGGWPLTVARLSGVRVRVAHSHLDTEAIDARASVPRRIYLAGMKTLVKNASTYGLAASRQAAPSVFGRDWEQDGRYRIFYCAIDLAPFENIRQHRRAVRDELNLPHDALIIGHVGRFFEQKNHAYLLDIAQALKPQLPQARFVLVGDGPLRDKIEQQATARGVREMFVFLGLRSDVHRIMSAMDVFALPSKFEGLPLVGIEAQAAGLMCLIADTVTPEIKIVPEHITFLPITEDAVDAWVNHLLRVARQPAPLTPQEALMRVSVSPFNIATSIAALEEVYRGDSTAR